MFSKLKKSILLPIIILFLAAAVFYGYQTYIANKSATKIIPVLLKVDTGNQFTELKTQLGTTALDLTQQRMAVSVKGEGSNAYVVGINGRDADSSKKEYWAFYVNGKLSDVGAGSYQLKSGDKIEWKIEKY